jgi:hypothetical protein
MKKILTIAIVLFSMASYAQGNLQFNRVRTYTGINNTTFDTVPKGKLWKIESMGISGGRDFSNSLTGCLTINNACYSNVAREINYGNNNVISLSVIKETIWLQSGDYLGWAGAARSYVVSIIEYNIIQ